MESGTEGEDAWGRTSGNINFSDMKRGKEKKFGKENIKETLVGKIIQKNTNLVIINWKVSNTKSEMFHSYFSKKIVMTLTRAD